HVSTGELPRIPANVVRKLVAFSVLLLIAPILVYFFSLKYVFVGSTAPSAIAAVIAANMVLAGYVYAAWVEDSESNSQEKPK
ncbi:vacuolar ATPase assembly integral membrane protein VMA21, partial [Martensiomyces pterosporus]